VNLLKKEEIPYHMVGTHSAYMLRISCGTRPSVTNSATRSSTTSASGSSAGLYDKIRLCWMRINQYVSVLDTCVLAPMPVADTLLRLADEPASFYSPRWSQDILKELRTTLHKFGFTATQIAHRIEQMEGAFPDAAVDGYEHLIGSMKNNSKDRHVLAAALDAEHTA